MQEGMNCTFTKGKITNQQLVDEKGLLVRAIKSNNMFSKVGTSTPRLFILQQAM